MKYEKIHLKNMFPFLAENGCDPTLEVYLPYNMSEMGRENDRRPCVLICPGGGYGAVSQRESEPIALKFLSKGYNAFVITYSVAPNRFPVQLREVAAVMELISLNAAEWNCNSDKVAIIGFSAGGHLAAHYSTSYNCPEIRELFPESRPVAASVLCYPVITASPTFAHIGSFYNLLGKNELSSDDIEKFSCENTVTAETPPAFIWHTAADTCVPVENSMLYASALSKYKIPFELHIYPFGGHGLSTADSMTNDNISPEISRNSNWINDALDWLEIIL